jgi:DNA-binding NtrC family response regulator
VLGGTVEQREAVARAFHQSSPVRRGPFLSVDCAREEPRLSRALQSWLMPDGAGGDPNPLRESERGTLYLDAVGSLSAPTQRLLLILARRLQGEPLTMGDGPGPFRLAAGSPEDLEEAVEQRRFSSALYDCLDKIRVGLGRLPRQGAA